MLAVEGVTIVRIGQLLNVHVFVGVLLIPPVLLKVTSTGWRFVKYYWGEPQYRRKGPPQILLRLLGPLVVVLSFGVLATGVALVIGAPASWHANLFQLHRITFVLWFVVTAVHVLGHVVETARLAPADWMRRTHRQVRGASVRQWAVAVSLAAGVVAALWIVPYASNWRVA